MKKKTEKPKKNMLKFVLMVLFLLILPILLDKGTDFAYKILYRRKKD